MATKESLANSPKFGLARFSALLGMGLCWVSLVTMTTPLALGQKYHPEHPEVRAMVEQGVSFIKATGGGHEGDRIIQALAVMNSYLDAGYYNDAFVLTGVNRALDLAAQYEAQMDNFDGNNLRQDNDEDVLRRMYEPCVALMMLVEYDDVKYSKQIDTLIRFVLKRQQAVGAWSYNFDNRGDSSQSQYCCLALWIAHEKGFDVPLMRSERAAQFWMGAQAGNGTWAYMNVPGQRIGSDNLSLNAAGAGSLYMLGDILGVNPPQKAKVATPGGSLELPGFVERLTAEEAERVLENAAQVKQEVSSIDVTAFTATKGRANQWMAANFTANNFNWPYYALYGFERYASFREKIDGSVVEIPDWYDQGIEFIKDTQRGDGGFPGTSEAGSSTQTALAILFMVRSTKRLTQFARDAVTKGNRGLGQNIQTRNGRVINEAQKKDMDQLLADLTKKDMTPEELQYLAESIREGALTNIKDKSTAQQLTLLREMVTDKRPLVRIIAVRALGQARLVDNCPALIYALTDPNPEVVQEASIALQFVSRKSEVPPVPKAGEKELEDGRIEFLTDSPSYKQGIRELYKYWADWYLELKPNAELFPVDLN